MCALCAVHYVCLVVLAICKERGVTSTVSYVFWYASAISVACHDTAACSDTLSIRMFQF